MSEKLNKNRLVQTGTIAVLAFFLTACGATATLSPEEIQEIAERLATLQAGQATPTRETIQPSTLTPTPTELPTLVPTPTATPVPTEIPTQSTETALQQWLKVWPDTAEEAAVNFGGSLNQWTRNSEWDNKVINNPDLGIKDYLNREWRVTDPNNLPFKWPKTPEEAAEYFFPGAGLDPRFIQAAWKDPQTGIITGWHLSEDHWLIDGTPADLNANIHTGEVAEGYTVNGTLDPTDDRNWVVFGGFKQANANDTVKITQVSIAQKGQGMTVWMPGTDPNAVALRMELFKTGDTPYYTGSDGQQLGPDAYGFISVYPTHDKPVVYNYQRRSRAHLTQTEAALRGINNPGNPFPQGLGRPAKNPFAGLPSNRYS